MDLKYRFWIVVILVLTSCSFVSPEKSSKSMDDSKLFHSNYAFTDSSQVANFECEEFVSDALNNYTIASVSKEFVNLLACTKELVVNKHDSALIDTIYTFSNTQNKIQIYRAKQNEFIFTFDVRDSLFKLPGKIKPGISKQFFTHQFQITETIGNKVQLFNSEGNMRFLFYFENNTLTRINSYLYLD